MIFYFCDAGAIAIENEDSFGSGVDYVWYAKIFLAKSRGDARSQCIQWLGAITGYDFGFTYPLSIRRLPTQDKQVLGSIEWINSDNCDYLREI